MFHLLSPSRSPSEASEESDDAVSKASCSPSELTEDTEVKRDLCISAETVVVGVSDIAKASYTKKQSWYTKGTFDVGGPTHHIQP